MKGMPREDQAKIAAVKQYLERYAQAKENAAALSGIELRRDYERMQRTRNETIMRDIERVIAQLPVSRGKTILEKRFLGGETWPKIYLDLQIPQTTALTVYRAAMLQAWGHLHELGIL